MTFRCTHPVLQHLAAVLWLLAPGLGLLPLAALAQNIPGIATTTAPEVTWKTPDITALSPAWWTNFIAGPEASFDARTRLLVQSLVERSKSLGPEDQAIAQASIANLKSLFELLAVARSGALEEQFAPVPARDTYSLGDFLQLRHQGREDANRQAQVNLQIEQTQSQLVLQKERRDNLLRQYKAADAESPARILLGINRVTARVEYALNETRSKNLQKRLKQIEQQIILLDEQQTFARQHLVHTDWTLKEVDQAAADARAAVSTTAEKIGAIQPLLLDALSENPPKPGLETLRKQQMIRAVVAAELAKVQEALARYTASWYRLRTGALGSGFDRREAAAEVLQITGDAMKQADLGVAASQATLIATVPSGDLNTVKNFELAQTAARETLVMINQISEVSDDLLLVQEILSTEITESQSGLVKIWDQISFAVAKTWGRLVRVAEVSLFEIGDAPVTPAGLFKMVLIMLLAIGASWLIRYLLNRGISRDKVSKQAAAYTLGRLLHYLIILIGIFAALGSIGIDFTSFALIAGALSVGIGFGLQAIVNNFVSGLILLFEGTLRVGDYVELDSGLQGVVREINTRATIVNTNDGVDVVVPNSELVTTKLTNWTLRESIARIRIPFSVAYGSDKERVRELALEAARSVEFALLNVPGREPQVWLASFGDNALEFQALLWVSRAGVRRPGRMRSSYLWALETLLRDNNIEIPFPQRDVRLRSDSVVTAPPSPGADS